MYLLGKQYTNYKPFFGNEMKLLPLFLFLFCFEIVVAQNQATGVRLESSMIPSARIACGPWLQAVGENEFTVVWTTVPDAVVWVEVAPNDGTNFYQKERPKYYESEYGRRLMGKLHHVRISGLEKGTTYRYRLFQQAVLLNEGNKRVVLGEAFGSDIKDSSPFSVTTLDHGKKEINFTMVNDIHGNDSIFRLLMSDVKNRKADFVVFNGDMLTQIESEQQMVDGYLKSASQLFASHIPLFAVRGNHENRGVCSYDFFKYFPNSNNNAYYTFRQGPAYFICMDSGEDKPDSDIRYYGLSTSDQMREEEAKWLKQVVESKEFKEAPVKIVVLHMPPVGKNKWHGMSEINRLFLPVLNQAGIDLMLCGHTHSHSYIGKGTFDNNFPILINSNLWRTDVSVTSEGIQMKLVDASGNTVQAYSIRK